MAFKVWGKTPSQEMITWAVKGLAKAMEKWTAKELLHFMEKEDHDASDGDMYYEAADCFGEEIELCDYNYAYITYVLEKLIGEE